MRRLLYGMAVAMTGALVWTAPVQASSVSTVVPNANETTEGDTNSAYPLGLNSMRYQQLYAASEFDGELSTITGMSFRPDGQFGSSFSRVLEGMIIRLSTTSLADFSTTFADNYGGDLTTVFEGTLELSSDNTGPTDGPKDFDVNINFTTLFNYDPSQGDLLVEVINPNNNSTTYFDAVADSPVMEQLWSNSTDAEIGYTSGGDGLVTQFNMVPVPSPAAAPFGLALMLGMGMWRRPRRADVESVTAA